MLSPSEGYGDPGISKTIPGYGKKKSQGSFPLQQHFLGLMYYEQLFLTAVDLISTSYYLSAILLNYGALAGVVDKNKQNGQALLS